MRETLTNPQDSAAPVALRFSRSGRGEEPLRWLSSCPT